MTMNNTYASLMDVLAKKYLSSDVVTHKIRDEISNINNPKISSDILVLYRWLLSKDKDDVHALVNTASCYLDYDCLDISNKLASRAIYLRPDNAGAYVILGRLFFREDTYKKCIKVFNRARKFKYHDIEYLHANIARCYFFLGHINKAKNILDNKIMQGSNNELAMQLLEELKG
ncbi:MAG: hypothetical protein GY869_30190, partial [Planctomycetes bacterium]|nr:hypothetical protein [Planctomycetota bacterium]